MVQANGLNEKYFNSRNVVKKESVLNGMESLKRKEAGAYDKKKRLFPEKYFTLMAGRTYPFPKRQIFYVSKLKECADDIFKFDETGRKFSKRVENIVGNGRNCSSQAISPFPAVFSKDLYSRHTTTRACLEKG